MSRDRARDPDHGGSVPPRATHAGCPHLPAEDLVAWLDGELAEPDARRVAAHVAACAACAREADLLRRSGELLARLPSMAPTAGFAESVVEAARQDADAPRSRVVRRRFPAWAAGIAAAVLLAVGGAWLATRSADPSELSSREEEDIARDLLVLAHLETLQSADDAELGAIADDLDVLELAGDLLADDGGG